MAVLFYSPQAQRDLVEIGNYLAGKNPRAAENMLAEIYKSCEQLKDFPLSGQSCDEIRPGARHLVIGNYLAFHHVKNNTVEIIRVIHSARDLLDML